MGGMCSVMHVSTRKMSQFLYPLKWLMIKRFKRLSLINSLSLINKASQLFNLRQNGLMECDNLARCEERC